MSNIVSLKKKNRQIKICIDFRDLNRGCPRDDLLVPHTDLLEDATMGYEVLTFMDRYSKYNQIKMHPKMRNDCHLFSKRNLLI